MNAVGAGQGAPSVDLATMRASCSQVLPPEVTPADPGLLETLTGLLRGHLQLIIPEVEQAATQMPVDDVLRYCALACVGEARGKVSATRGLGAYDAAVYARRLARSLLAMCDHYEALAGKRRCLARDSLVRGEEVLPYSKVSPPGGAVVCGRIHGSCAGTVPIR